MCLERARLTPMVAAEEQQTKAVEDFKMITEDEATIRKTIGAGIGLVTVAIYSTFGMAYGTLSGAIFAAISIYRTGAEYQ